ncbi:MAG: sulfatase, partial [Campylobacterales bacterium]|nr:sulfatase [Campylobacterales bacterium]
IVYAPEIIQPKVIHKLSSQIDTLPTLLALMGWEYESQFYGDNILDPNFKERAFIGNYQKLGLLKEKNLFVLEPDRTIHQYHIVEESLKDATYQETDHISPRDALEIITYYQSASDLYTHHINRWHKRN